MSGKSRPPQRNFSTEESRKINDRLEKRLLIRLTDTIGDEDQNHFLEDLYHRTLPTFLVHL